MTTKTTVLYNGACPICRREIDHYRRLDRQGDQALGFTDISADGRMLERLVLSEDAAKRRLHVLGADGRLLAGVPAFAAIWERLPRYRWMARLSRVTVLGRLLGWAYEPIAFALYRLDRRRTARRVAAGD